jgi:hypothetical protein
METDMDKNSFFQPIPNTPPELSMPLPRRIRPSSDARYGEIVLALMLGLTVILSLWLCKNVVQQMRLRSALRHGGAEVLAEITYLDRPGRGGDIVRYTFTANGEIASGEAGVPLQLVKSLRESNSLTVRYLPSDPAINHPAAWEWSFLSNSVGIIFLMILVSIFGLFRIILYRRRQLLAWGKPVLGVVTECVSAKSSFSLKYNFRTESGVSFKGGGDTTTRQEIGASIWILYLPQNPARNQPYPFSDYCVEP